VKSISAHFEIHPSSLIYLIFTATHLKEMLDAGFLRWCDWPFESI